MTGLKVLLVEDNATDVLVIEEALKRAGRARFEVTQVGSLEAALNRLGGGGLDVVLLDLGLPDGQGLGTLRRMRAAAPAVPVVVLTGFDDEELALQAVKEGAQDYLFKDEAEGPVIARAIRYAIERKSVVEAAEAGYRLLFDHNPHPMWVYDAETLAFVAVNDAALCHYGYSREEFLSMTLKDIRPPEDVPAFLTVVSRPPAENAAPRLWRHRKKDGTVIDVEVRTSAVNFAGRPARLVLASDVTEQKQLEENFRQSQKLEAVGRLAGGIAHDFNNLMTIITGRAGMLLERLRPEDPQRRDIDQIRKTSERAAELTRQLLAFSRRQILQPRLLELNLVVAGLTPMLRSLVGEAIELLTLLGPGLGPVRADPSQLEQVILNLAVNARDAMPNGGKLTLETANVELDEGYASRHVGVQPGPYVQLAVSDTGVGMDEATLSRVFEPFFTTKERGKGTGLGLATVYGIVKQSGGNIWVYSESGRGTTFKIYLPRVGEVVEPVEPATRPAEPRRGAETILLVEDEDELRAVAREVLEMYGYTVLEARRPDEALGIAEGHGGRLHLLLTDVVMPGMSGPELAKRLVPLRPEMAVLYVSGYTDDAIVHHGVLDPGTEFLEKPFDPVALARKVREVLDREKFSRRG